MARSVLYFFVLADALKWLHYWTRLRGHITAVLMKYSVSHRVLSIRRRTWRDVRVWTCPRSPLSVLVQLFETCCRTPVAHCRPTVAAVSNGSVTLSPKSITLISTTNPQKVRQVDDTSVGRRRRACCVDHKSDAVDWRTSTPSNLWSNPQHLHFLWICCTTFDVLYNLLYNKSTTYWSNGVWALMLLSLKYGIIDFCLTMTVTEGI